MSATPPVAATAPPSQRQGLAELYEADETAWLEESSRLIRAGQVDALDYENLASYLDDMARRDRREVESRLDTLIKHLLKWRYQPDHRTNSWKATILEQRRQLQRLLTGTLRRHAEAVLAECYQGGAQLAAAEAGLAASTFPTECPFTLDQILTEELF